MAETKPVDSSELEAGTVPVAEKHTTAHGNTTLHEYAESEGYVVDGDDGSLGGFKLAKDGKTRLIPQPSDDPKDPLNWSWSRKHLILFIVSWTAFLPDYSSATGAVTLLAQAA
jgi:hypothetical protein